MDVADFDYDLPTGAIAQVPVEPRDAARLLVDRGPNDLPADKTVADLAELVGPGDLLVVNDSRVLPARLRLQKSSGGSVEVLLVERRLEGGWEALVRPSRRVPPGSVLSGAGLRVTVGEDLGEGRRIVRLDGGRAGEAAAIAANGTVPLPPYIRQELTDPERYQTVFARRPVSAAAPTAGLHLTPEVLDRCRAAGAKVEAIELAVGVATFRPITATRVEHHEMHGERYLVPSQTMLACREAQRVIAVGTTVVRALESAAVTGQLEGRTELFIRSGHHFEVVDLLLTNFHVPRSSLLVLVDAFVGSRWHELYAIALDRGYRFLSFGDAMLLRHEGAGRGAR